MAITSEIPIIPLVFLLIYTPILSSGHRKILHQPFFPVEALPPAIQPPLPPPRQQLKHPFSTTQSPFFPLPISPPPPPPPPTVAITFPANISSLPLQPRSSKPISRNFVALAVLLSLLSAAFIAALILFHLRCWKPAKIKTESRRLFPSKTPSSDKPPPERSPASTGNLSGEYLYIGTMRGIEENFHPKHGLFSSIATSSAGEYQRLSSPELHPLPPLPRHQPFSNEFCEPEGDEEFEQFFSPILSPNNILNKNNNNAASSPPSASFQNKISNLGYNSLGSSISSSPIDSMQNNTTFMNLSSRSLNSNSSDLLQTSFRAQTFSQNNISSQTHDPPCEKKKKKVKTEPLAAAGQDNPLQLRPPPPPLPSPRFWEFFEVGKGGQVAADDLEWGEEGSSSRPRLKPLHWEKVRASSDRAMAWDHIKSSSFRLNEEMMETLFMINGHSSTSRESTRNLKNQNRILEPKKSQNIAILLRALNVTVDEVCDALIEGPTDTLGTDLLESLLKMVPSKEEERKLKEFKDDFPAKLSPAEKFLKAVLNIPFAFQRVEAMVYVVNFESEVEYLTRSFATIKAACEELKNSGMFRKLLDTVLQTGNRMNLGTTRGNAQAFKLDTLLNLVDVKGIDGKTTLLHFVVQEISRVEGSSIAITNPSSTPVQCNIESLKFGLRVIASLSRELDNVKKAADMDGDVLGNEVIKLSHGISKINEVLKLNEEYIKLKSGERFSESMKGFLNRADREILKVRGLERECLCLVKEITEYFHSNLDKEEAHRFRIFTVVRDFIYILDGVCKDVEKVNKRNFVGLGSLSFR